MLSYDDELTSLLARATDTPYGVAATVWTKDIAFAKRAGRSVERIQGVRLGTRDGQVRYRCVYRGQGCVDALRVLTAGDRGSTSPIAEHILRRLITQRLAVGNKYLGS